MSKIYEKILASLERYKYYLTEKEFHFKEAQNLLTEFDNFNPEGNTVEYYRGLEKLLKADGKKLTNDIIKSERYLTYKECIELMARLSSVIANRFPQEWNQKGENLASANIIIYYAIKDLLGYKINGNQAHGSTIILLGIKYLKNPKGTLPMLSNADRNKVSQQLWNENYNESTFLDGIQRFFAPIIDKIQISNPDNLNLLYNRILYDIKYEWDIPVIKKDIIDLKDNEFVYKISMSPKDIDDQSYDYFIENSLAIVHKDTPAKGRSFITQGQIFQEMNVGDYFFICRGNYNIELIGVVVTKAEPCEYEDWGDEGWLQIGFEIVKKLNKIGSYIGNSKWWTPNNNSTCIWIPDREIELANEWIFVPHFGIKFKKSGFSLEKEEIMTEKIEINNPKNQILYGPPGTGKTFHTINHALAVIGKTSLVKIKELENTCDVQEAKEFFADTDLILEETTDGRQLLRAIFDFYVKKGQIVFTTFHQSMSYEDFIEGIKPLKPNAQGNVTYDIVEGVFKKIAENATSNYKNTLKENKKKLEFNEAFEKLKSDIEQNPESKFPLKLEGYDFTIIGFNDTSIQFRKSSGGTSHTLSINTLREIYYGREFNFKHGVGIYYPSVLKKLESYSENNTTEATLNNYVLIIDEINRGNVSAIFGELITLIETDKRQEMPEALEVTLPYSKEPFSVSQNLYIIGTMNTADRSVEALDTALRRRFTFVEMMPKAELLTPYETLKRYWLKRYGDYGDTFEEFEDEEKPLWDLLGLGVKPDKKEDYLNTGNSPETYQLSSIEFKDKIDELVEFKNGINLQTILETINNRIEILLDRDHLIGHSYFMNVYSLEELKETFAKNIIPLLQEYFFGDYGKIALVLGSGFCSLKTVFENLQDIFAENDNGILNSYNGKKQYELLVPEDIKTAINILLTGKAN